MQKTIETIVNDYNAVKKIGGLMIAKEDKRFTKAFDISIKELNEFLEPYNFYAFQDEADDDKDNQYLIDKLEYKEQNEKLINGKINFKG